MSNTARVRVNAVGYYGWGNFGDELFRAVVTSHAERFWGEGAIVRTFVFPSIALRTSAGIVGRAVRAGEAIIGGLWADRVAFCGGSVLSAVSGTAALRLRWFGKRDALEAWGVSVGPFRDGDAAHEVAALLGSMRSVVVRDAKSVERSPVPVHLAGDLAALHPMPRIEESQRAGLTICPSVDAGESPNEVASAIRTLLPERHAGSITLLALNSRRNGGDVRFCEEVRRALAASGIVSRVEHFTTIEQVLRRIAHSRAVWSQRLHGLIAAYLCDVPVFVMTHHAKLDDFSADIGLRDEFVLAGVEPRAHHVSAARETLRGFRGWTVDPELYARQTKERYLRVAG
ncbi:polysaccharide pyruvyl transferase family protein [Leucobacter sp. USHLN153]|uniref:polysaccharide pyruvyl transferase family protein n=1 Tax=Leucobacter sp. USHLN153 TaxID=3081268 RepID=UPI00301B6654